MDKERRGEIAEKMVEHFIRQRGITPFAFNRNEFENMSKEIGVPAEEIHDFMKPLARRVFNECFYAPRKQIEGRQHTIGFVDRCDRKK